MKPIFNIIGDFIDKYLIHIPEEKKAEFKQDILVAGSMLIEAGTKGAVEGGLDKAGNKDGKISF